MPLIQDDAVVIGRLDYSETSQVLVLFAREHGKVRAIAKGMKRSTKTRFAAGVDLLDAGRVVVSSRAERAAGLATLTEWKQTRCFSGLRGKLFRLHAAQYAAEVLAHLTEDWDPHPPLFDAFVATLDVLAHADEPLPTITRYQCALLTSIGSMPRVDECVLCGRSNDLSHFASLEGGTICRNCEPGQIEKREDSPRSLETLRSLGTPRAFETLPSLNSVRTLGGDGAGDPPVDMSEPRAAQAKDAARRGEAADTAHHLGAFDILDYHLSHLMGREPALAALLVRPEDRRRAQANPVADNR